MLRNRVDPFGQIITTTARGLWMGNRGVIHNRDQEITHSFKHKAWITCVLQFKGRRRTVMTPNRWTELFFRDEATAFAAGHRPCFECRREDAKRFKDCWIRGNPEYKFTMETSITQIDEVIHRERIDGEKKKITHQRHVSDIPDGSFIVYNNDPYLCKAAKIYRWSPFGYENCIEIPPVLMLTILTPLSIVNSFRAGYLPQVSF